MRELPILFSAPMVRAILDGRKTVTRRIVKPQPDFVYDAIVGRFTPYDERLGRLGQNIRCPYGQPGDRLWVRETWKTHSTFDHLLPRDVPESNLFYAAGPLRYSPSGSRWRPSIHMPRWASRITLEVTGVRVERLQDITYESALAEGAMDGARFCEEMEPGKRNELGESNEDVARRLEWPQRDFRNIWESINGAGSWEANPWVWVIEFRRIEQERKVA